MIDAVGTLLSRITNVASGRAATYFNVGAQNSPGNSVIVFADTGPLAAGEYEVVLTRVHGGSFNFELQHRDAANTANIRVSSKSHGFAEYVRWPRITVAANERIRIVKADGTADGGNWDWSFFVRLAT